MLIVALLLVPALARAQQALDIGRTASATSSFSRSGNVPPDHVSVAPDLAVTLIDIEAVLHPVQPPALSMTETLPDSPDLIESDTLRGPPTV